jgi:pimeloyl-ACP methyl ester carboxylesterase
VSVAVGSATYGGYRTWTLSVQGHGPRIVLMHGYSDCANTWDGVLDELARIGRAAVAVDLPGFGLADGLRPGPVLPQLDAFVAELVGDHAVRGPVLLVGNSLGGTLTVRAAVNGAPVLGAVTIGDPSAGPWRLRTWAGRRRTPLVLRVGRAIGLPTPIFRRLAAIALARVVYADRRAADPTVTARFVDFMIGRGGTRWLARDASALAREIVGGHGSVVSSAPLLIVHGVKDRIVPVAGSKALHARVAGSELHVAPSWGHCPQLDDPRGMAELLARFADGVSLRSVG